MYVRNRALHLHTRRQPGTTPSTHGRRLVHLSLNTERPTSLPRYIDNEHHSARTRIGAAVVEAADGTHRAVSRTGLDIVGGGVAQAIRGQLAHDAWSWRALALAMVKSLGTWIPGAYWSRQVDVGTPCKLVY